ncbi:MULTISPECIES: glycoside hydrolase [Streptomyces]|uniref:Uncharacterized protein n=2 Tax=Streptomyces rimosus subsp. rimosus TaxID=132474 RepID=L8EVG6_STRR1|nr:MULTISPECIES: glycoside hydrolase [Streptomyces]KOG71681.1 lipoprotein [Kitasatospora aureofaciens]MYT47539.1 hypothetical protein [Streptomyces sp. SID5471]KEF05883.1 hypothetical protein DF17_16925 [Streptomyces rimosus]KOT28253.1 lipoprotein [Streptomyces sp. NRRL WC-3701]KOT33595.1 lipoprotein [Streptomyces rimosus subsp. rimosus]
MDFKIASRGSRTRTRVLAASLALTATASVGASGCSSQAVAGPATGRHVDIPVRGGTVTVDTGTLALQARTADGKNLTLSAPSGTALGTPGPVERTGEGARWSYPDKGLTVTAAADHGRLRVSVKADRDGSLTWPVTGTDRATSSVQLPRGEGLDIPVRDTFWNSGKGGLTGDPIDVGGLELPLWGTTLGKGHGVSYLTPTDLGTSLKFRSEGGRLNSSTTHDFTAGDGTRDYTVTFALTDGNPVAPGADYRSWLAEHGQLGSLREKIKQNPANGKLLGAFHAYVWGDARKAAGVEELRKLGVDRMWLGYDAGPDPMDAAAVRAAKKAGYLVGPYDTFANGQDPKTADSPTSKWPGTVYPDFCVRDAKGKPQSGFGNRGCYLSSQAFEQSGAGRGHLADRTRAMTANGADSYFLDVDATGELFRDHDAAHPMTKAGDRTNRLARMRRLAHDKKLVLGSESAQSWANGVLAFNHGGATPVADGLWKFERDRKNWGGYYPENAPTAFFKPVRLPADLAKAMYDPAYRVPLYETALHSSLVNAERWELSYEKLPEQKTGRALLAMLYNIPLNYVLDGASLKKSGPEMAALQKYFAPLHKATGTEKLTSFRRLTADNLVQRTEFGNGKLTVTANFGKIPYAGLPAGCVDAKLRGDRQPRRLCPAKAGG